MIVVELFGGLGNQMFQAATALALARKNSVGVVLCSDHLNDQTDKAHYTNRSFALEPFGLDSLVSKNPYKSIMPLPNDKLIRKVRRKFSGVSFYYESGLSFDNKVLQLSKNAYLHGYFQSEKYFEYERDYIRDAFTVQTQFSYEVRDQIKSYRNLNVLAVHVRRGDYISDPKINEIHGAMDVSYYKRGYEVILSGFKPDRVCLFSDDPDWAEANLTEIFDCPTDISRNRSAIEDFEVMRSCKSFIIANSSFSWWAAWLSETENTIVVAPDKWFNDKNKISSDLIPSRWKTI